MSCEKYFSRFLIILQGEFRVHLTRTKDIETMQIERILNRGSYVVRPCRSEEIEGFVISLLIAGENRSEKGRFSLQLVSTMD